jgi:hypothetical protein
LTNTHAAKGILIILLSLTALATAVTSARAGQQTADKEADTKIRVTIYPILVKAPVFGASVDLPSLPPGSGSGGDEAGDITGSTDTALNAAYMGGLVIEAHRWFAEGYGTWANLSATRSTPRIIVSSDSLFFVARGGVRLVGGLSVTAGVRHAIVDLDATLTLPVSEQPIEGHAKPGIWDPLIGIDWRRNIGSWTIDGNFQGGGFGVGADVDLSAELHARWRIVRHVELRAGYSLIYFKLTAADVSIGSFQRTLVTRQTLHGPELGLGIVF